MKFQITPNAKGRYVTSTGANVEIAACAHGKDYADEAAFAAALKLTSLALIAARERKANELQIAFEKQCGDGAEVSVLGHTFRLLCDDAGRSALDEFRSHEIARLAMAVDDAARTAIRAEPFALRDVAGRFHAMSIGDAITVIISVGETYKTWWVSQAQKQAMVNAASTVESVNAILA